MSTQINVFPVLTIKYKNETTVCIVCFTYMVCHKGVNVKPTLVVSLLDNCYTITCMWIGLVWLQ